MNCVSYALLISVFLTPASAIANEDLSESWLDLWTRCRVAIEEAQALDVDGLRPAELPPSSIEEDPVFGSSYARRGWARDGDRFVIAEGEWGRHGSIRRFCDVMLALDAAPLGDSEQAMLVHTFLVERWALIASRTTHEVRDPDQIFPISLGVGPVEENSNGCSVISGIVIDTRSDFFMSGTGEQARSGCAGPSFLSNEPATDR